MTGVVLRMLARWLPGLMARRFDGVLSDMQDDGYADVSYRVFNIGEANHLPAYSMELAVALEGDRHVAAVDRILQIAREQRRRLRYHTSPIALRFVAPSPAFASMMHDRPTMMIELIVVDGTLGGYRLLARYEERLADLGARAHWGQVNALTAERVAAAYSRWDAWLALERELNASRVFDSPFARRVGICA